MKILPLGTTKPHLRLSTRCQLLKGVVGAITIEIAKVNVLNERPSQLHVTALIDWNSQIFLSKSEKSASPLQTAKLTFDRTTKRIANCLSTFSPQQNFQVSLRLYHGWHKGFEPSINRKAIKQAIAETDFSVLSHKPRVIFAENVGFGDCLLTALPTRLHDHLSIHLPDTLRDRGAHGVEEKMVDTALAADLIVSAYQYPEEWLLVAAEDDDLIPPIFAAEAILKHKGSRILLMCDRKRTKKYLKLEGILV
jgi:hypothetical protein